MIEWLEFMTTKGYCPNLVCDDDGHWAVSVQSLASCRPKPDEITIFTDADQWADSIEGAIMLARDEWPHLEDEYNQLRKES